MEETHFVRVPVLLNVIPQEIRLVPAGLEDQVWLLSLELWVYGSAHKMVVLIVLGLISAASYILHWLVYNVFNHRVKNLSHIY